MAVVCLNKYLDMHEAIAHGDKLLEDQDFHNTEIPLDADLPAQVSIPVSCNLTHTLTELGGTNRRGS